MSTMGQRIFDAPTEYRIHVRGYLDESWSAFLGGLAIQSEVNPGEAAITELIGEFQDQAALAGVLNTLFDLRLTLLSVECMDFHS